MSTNLCGTCKHWGRPDEKDARFRTCQGVKHDKKDLVVEQWQIEAGYLDVEIWEEDVALRLAAMDATKAVTKDGSGYSAKLVCRDDFGCVLFEPKE